MKKYKVNIELISFEPSYKTEWKVQVSGDDSFEVIIISYPEETKKSLLRSIKQLNEISINSIMSLSKKNLIVFD